MGLRDMIRAIREYPAVHAELETAHAELHQVQQALEQSEQERGSLSATLSKQKDFIGFLFNESMALRSTLKRFCSPLSAPEDLKRFYDMISPGMDPHGFKLYRTAQELTGIDVPSFFPYEDNCGLFEEMDGHRLMDWLTAAHFQAVDWGIVPGACCEAATLREVNTSTPKYRAFEKRLYKKALERMGFQDILAPNQKKGLAKLPSHSPPQPKKDRGGYEGR